MFFRPIGPFSYLTCGSGFLWAIEATLLLRDATGRYYTKVSRGGGLVVFLRAIHGATYVGVQFLVPFVLRQVGVGVFHGLGFLVYLVR